MSEKELEQVRGRDAAMIFQDPMSSLNPTLSIGRQIMEPVLLHQKVSRREAQAQALRLLELVGIPQPEIRFGQYPHHFSGGMRQRAAVAIALAAGPRLLIADEPTTALDPDTQDQIMGLLRQLASDRDRAMLLVTHDLGLAEQIADKIAVMKEGRIVETGTAAEVFASPRHPYTKQLLRYARYGKGGSHYHGAIGWERHGKAAIDGTPLPEEKKPDGHPLMEEEREPLVEITGLTKGFRLGRGRVPVSYTHLDVYKRQMVRKLSQTSDKRRTDMKGKKIWDKTKNNGNRRHRRAGVLAAALLVSAALLLSAALSGCSENGAGSGDGVVDETGQKQGAAQEQELDQGQGLFSHLDYEEMKLSAWQPKKGYAQSILYVDSRIAVLALAKEEPKGKGGGLPNPTEYLVLYDQKTGDEKEYELEGNAIAADAVPYRDGFLFMEYNRADGATDGARFDWAPVSYTHLDVYKRQGHGHPA